MDRPTELSGFRGRRVGRLDRHSSAAESLGPERSSLGLVRLQTLRAIHDGRASLVPSLGELGSQASSRPHRPQKSPEQSLMDGGDFWSLRPPDDGDVSLLPLFGAS